jgi:serine/threonine-protein kinase
MDDPHGPGGTRMLAAEGPVTVAEQPPAVTEQHAPLPTTADADRAHTLALRQRRQRRWVIAILVILLLGTAAAAGGWWLGGRWSATPSAVGLSQSDAETLVRNAGLVPRVTTEHHNEVPAGRVASSDPAPGTEQLRGSEVDLLISSGRPLVPAIPAGTDEGTARAALTAADLQPVDGSKPDFDDKAPPGTLLRTDPVAGTELNISAPVTLVLSAGPAPVTVPDVAGKSPEDAQNKLVVAGFALGPPRKTFDPKSPDGAVLGSAPAAGTTAPRGSEVSLQLAASLTVPDVRGQPTEDAARTLEKAGFTVTVGDPAFDADFDADHIMRTDPAQGTKVDPNAAAVFLVPSNAVTVPDLTDGTVQQARQKLDTLGLKLSVSAFFGGDDGTIWNQSPSAGGRVAPGGTVFVSVLF